MCGENIKKYSCGHVITLRYSCLTRCEVEEDDNEEAKTPCSDCKGDSETELDSGDEEK
jgi:hypothetical protein